ACHCVSCSRLRSIFATSFRKLCCALSVGLLFARTSDRQRCLGVSSLNRGKDGLVTEILAVREGQAGNGACAIYARALGCSSWRFTIRRRRSGCHGPATTAKALAGPHREGCGGVLLRW